MRTTAEIVRLSVTKAILAKKMEHGLVMGRTDYLLAKHVAMLAATYACEMAQADAAALLKPVTMRASDGGTRREQ